MTKLILIKYPQSELDVMRLDEVMPEDSELGLTDAGRRAAEQLGRAVSETVRGKHAVWSGSAKRSADPARIIADALGVKATTDGRLDERYIGGDTRQLTVGDFRNRQERAYLDPSRLAEGERESPLTHRLRVEGWLAEILSTAAAEDVHVVVSHGAVVEHLHSALSWKPAGAMGSSFTFCAPGHAHLWADVVLPDQRRIWCCLGSNVDLAGSASRERPVRGLDDLDGLAVDLASDPRFQHLAEEAAQGEISPLGSEKYYIR